MRYEYDRPPRLLKLRLGFNDKDIIPTVLVESLRLAKSANKLDECSLIMFCEGAAQKWITLES